MLLELLREIALGIGEALPRERDDRLNLQILDVDLASGKQCTLLLHCQQIAFMGNGEEPERADVFDRADEAKIDLAEPDLATLVRIAKSLGTSPNCLLGVAPSSTKDLQLSAYIKRFACYQRDD